ncbi:hypothetical protein A2165_02510 [Candidatus Curtissbacteria bacterium RBG_13_40_7]|uniref:N-acetyltransferase domain-containing protein n=1 Tax=Candidatus Curtissbacteria bacterium RBG_13_40_7 TaxID=1797706 RepID=A0A1F5FYN3_9BACT|nr:MAG: hypothetical protein A2165_02510 [Candidatus Curtissbacteria bacterium RBG_13_40_7]
MGNIKVVKGTPEQFEDFYKLWKKTLEDGLFLYSKNSVMFTIEEELPKEFLKAEIEKGNKHFFLAYINNKPAGYLLTNKTKGGIAFGHWLGVDSKFQKQGTVSALLSFWEKDALKKGTHKLQLWTTKNNLAFYKNRGFIKGGDFPDSWFGIDHFLFYKTLRKSDEKVFLKDFLKKKRD